MKKVIIGAIVATVIFFGWQSAMWMSGIYSDFYTYTPNQDAVMQTLNDNLSDDGLYLIPAADCSTPEGKEEGEKIMEQNVGKPWAMIIYHKKMMGMEIGYMLLGLFYTLISCFIASLVIYHGSFNTFWIRFLVVMCFSIFTLSQGVLDNMTWWGYPWSFVKPEVIDLTIGWGITALWLAWFVKK